nr:unnamed protein product [Meloidogyne enterolobii]
MTTRRASKLSPTMTNGGGLLLTQWNSINSSSYCGATHRLMST